MSYFIDRPGSCFWRSRVVGPVGGASTTYNNSAGFPGKNRATGGEEKKKTGRFRRTRTQSARRPRGLFVRSAINLALGRFHRGVSSVHVVVLYCARSDNARRGCSWPGDNPKKKIRNVFR